MDAALQRTASAARELARKTKPPYVWKDGVFVNLTKKIGPGTKDQGVEEHMKLTNRLGAVSPVGNGLPDFESHTQDTKEFSAV